MSDHVVVDIRTRFLREDQRCYILFPGSGYRHYDSMQNGDVVFLDIPGFPYGPKDDLSSVKDLTKRVIVSERIKDWHSSDRPEDKLPPRTVKELKGARETTSRQQFAGLIRGFFVNIRRGDIIIVPCQTYEGFVLFGEIIDDGAPTFVSIDAYPEEQIPARRVKWIKRIVRSSIPGWLERKIGSPNPLRQIEREHFDEIFDIMYERYFYDGRFVCKFSVKSKEFSALDNFLFQQIVLYAAALHEAKHEGNISNISETPISIVVSKLEFSEDIPDQRISINSPGHIIVYSRNIIPLVAGALMMISATATSAEDMRTATIAIENSLDTSQISVECVSEIQAEVIDDLNAMGYRRWQELCAIEAQARKRTEVHSGMSAGSTSDVPAKRGGTR